MKFRLIEEFNNVDIQRQIDELYSDIPLEEAGSEFTFTTREFEQILKYNGYTLNRITGDHKIYTKPGHNHIAVMAGKKTPNNMVLRRLIKENGLEIPKKLRKS